MELKINNIGRAISTQTRIKQESLISFNADRLSGYIPLIQLYQTLSRRSIFQGEFYDMMFYEVLKDAFVYHKAETYYRFKKQMLTYGGNEIKALSISMLSVFGLKEPKEVAISSILLSKRPDTIIINTVDVMSLCLHKLNKVNTIQSVMGGRDMIFNTDDLLVLVSKQKLKSPAYMNTNYNSTSRNYLWRGYREFMEANGIKWEVVDDREIARYYHNPFSFNNSSVMEIMRIDKSIKEDVLINNKEYIKYD